MEWNPKSSSESSLRGSRLFDLSFDIFRRCHSGDQECLSNLSHNPNYVTGFQFQDQGKTDQLGLCWECRLPCWLVRGGTHSVSNTKLTSYSRRNVVNWHEAPSVPSDTRDSIPCVSARLLVIRVCIFRAKRLQCHWNFISISIYSRCC